MPMQYVCTYIDNRAKCLCILLHMFISNDRAQSQSLYHRHNGKQCKDGQCVYVSLVASNSFKLDQTCIRKRPNIHIVSHVTHPTNISQAKFCRHKCRTSQGLRAKTPPAVTRTSAKHWYKDCVLADAKGTGGYQVVTSWHVRKMMT